MQLRNLAKWRTTIICVVAAFVNVLASYVFAQSAGAQNFTQVWHAIMSGIFLLGFVMWSFLAIAAYAHEEDRK